MALFPDVIGSERGIGPLFTTKTTRLGQNQFARYRKSLRPRFAFDIAFDLLTSAQASSIDDHVIAVAGAGLTFPWFDWSPFHWLWVPVGTGDGSTTTFDLPGKNSSDLEVFTGTGSSAAVSSTSVGTGANGCDRFTLTSAPGNGVSIWCNATMRRLFTVTFEDDHQPLTRLLDTGYYQFSSRLRQVK